MREQTVVQVLGPGASISQVVRGAQRAGAEVVVVPAGEDKASSLERFAETLDLPDWFGRNLDALADCLHDLAETPPPEGATARHVVWDGTAALHAADPRAFEGICSVLQDVSDEHPAFTATVVDR
jgi:RNAse (barnase) inhibitor barstar